MNGTPSQTADAMAKRAVLRHRINTIRTVQAVYIPFVHSKLAQYRQTLRPSSSSSSISSSTDHSAPSHLTSRRLATGEVDRLDLPEIQPLFLPHQLSPSELDLSTPGLAEMEARLRDGQLTDSLDKLRVHLHIRSRLITYKNRHVRHQKYNTRARTRIDKNEAKINALKQKYRAARLAKLALVGHGDWEKRWRELADADVTTMRGDDEVVGIGISEGKRTLSWIWMGADDGGDASGIRGLSDGACSSSCYCVYLMCRPGPLHLALRVEYMKSRARKERYREDCLFVQEEKRRTVVTLEQTALKWDRREGQASSLKSCPIVSEGAAALCDSKCGKAAP